MGPAGVVLALGGAVSFAFGAITGFWLHAAMLAHPEDGPPRYRMTLHKEALWSSFLCFAIAGWVDQLPLPTAANVALAACVVLTGWFAMAQYFLVARAGVTNAFVDASPPGVGLFGKAALVVNLLAVGGLLVGTGLLALALGR